MTYKYFSFVLYSICSSIGCSQFYLILTRQYKKHSSIIIWRFGMHFTYLNFLIILIWNLYSINLKRNSYNNVSANRFKSANCKLENPFGMPPCFIQQQFNDNYNELKLYAMPCIFITYNQHNYEIASGHSPLTIRKTCIKILVHILRPFIYSISFYILFFSSSIVSPIVFGFCFYSVWPIPSLFMHVKFKF